MTQPAASRPLAAPTAARAHSSCRTAGAIRSFRMSSALTRVPLVPLVIAAGGRNVKVRFAVAMAKSPSVSLNPLARMVFSAHRKGVSPAKSLT